MKLFQTEVCGHVEPADATLGGAAPAIDVPSLSDTKARRRSGTSKLFPQTTYVICHQHNLCVGPHKISRRVFPMFAPS